MGSVSRNAVPGDPRRLIPSDFRKNKAAVAKLKREVRRVRTAVAETSRGLQAVGERVEPRLEEFEQKFAQVERDFRSIASELDQKDSEAKTTLQNLGNFARLAEQVQAQEKALGELQGLPGEDLGGELERVKKDFIQLKQDVFELQEGEKRLNGGWERDSRRSAA